MTQINEIVKTITEETPNIIIIKDYNGRFLFANQKIADLYGTTPQEMIGKTDHDFNSNKDQTDFYLHNIQRIMDNGEAETVYENSTDKATNEIRYFQSIKKPFLNHNKEKNILVIANDITTITLEQQQLEEKQMMLDIALEVIGEGVWDWNFSTNRVRHNKQWCDMFLVEDSKKIHDIAFFASLLHHDDADGVYEKIQTALQTTGIYESTHRMICTDGTIKWVLDRGRIIEKDTDGNPLRMIGSVRDITDSVKLKEKEKLLEKQSRLATLGEMMGNIAHQWRQPLSIISTLASTTNLYNTMGTLEKEATEQSMDAIVKQCEYLSNTITDFRNFIKNDRKQQQFMINTMVQKALSLAHASVAQHYIKIIASLDHDAICIGFESEILQALLNILNNAKDILSENIADETKRFIFVDVTKTYNTITIKIKDNAGGVPETIIDKIFDPYFTTKGDEVGTGLGLHMCKQIVEDSQGSVSVHNSDFDYDGITYKGAEFAITFPIAHEIERG